MAERDDDLLPMDEIPLEEVAAQQTMILGPTWRDRDGQVAQFTVVANATGTAYIPVNGLCEFAGIDPPGQRKKVQGHGVLKHRLRRFKMDQGKGGPQVTLCLELRAAPYFIANLDVQRVRDDLQPMLIPLQEAMVEAAFDFMLGLAIQAGVQPLQTESLADEVASLRHQMHRLQFALSGLRQRMNVVEAAVMPTGLPPAKQ